MSPHFPRRHRDPPAPDVALPGFGTPPGQQVPSPPPARRVKISFDQREIQWAAIRILLVVSAWLIAVWVVGVARHFLFLILLAWLAAIASEPAIRWFLRRGWSRTRSTAIVGTAVIAVCIGLVVVFQRMLFDQATQLVQSVPTTVQSIVDQLNSTLRLQLNAAQISNALKLDPAQIQVAADELAGGFLGWVGSVLAVTFDTVTVVVFAFYIAAAGPRLVQQVAVWLPPDRQPLLGEVWDIAEQKTGGYVASKIVLAAMSAFFHGVFFWAIGLSGWLPLALLAGITAQFIPVIGTYIGVAVPLLVALAEKPVIAVWIVLFAIVYQQIETYLFTPRVSQRTMEVNPAVALAAVFLGAAVWGPIGAIIGVPIAAVVVSIFQTYGRRYELVPHMASTQDSGEKLTAPLEEPTSEEPPSDHPGSDDLPPTDSGPPNNTATPTDVGLPTYPAMPAG